MTEQELKQGTKQFALRKLIIEGGLLRQGRVEALRQEACELTAIMAASRLSASRGPVPNRKSQI